ncbi:MAG: hypothetical protein M5U32_10975 [Myxococcota bacterium]|nr:hypothetical protein [Myxococcota bacterium]
MARPRIAFLILGMHRSGTSALTRVLSLCGAALPRNLIPAGDRNERGYFESQTIWRQHEALLAEAGTSWYDPSSIPEAWFDTPAAADWTERLAEAVHHEFGDSPVLVLKDPRLCRLLPLWRRVLAAVDAEPRCILPLRHPSEVAASLSHSEGIAERHALLLWLDYLLVAERTSRDVCRSFVLFDDLLADWRDVLTRIERDLDYRFPRRSRETEAEIDAFLTPALRHQRERDNRSGASDLHPWIDTVWRWALDKGADRPADSESLERVSAAWREAEAALGPVLASVELARRTAIREAQVLKELAAEQTEALDRSLREERAASRELRDRLAQRREELARLTSTSQMMLRWVVERGRLDGPAPAALRGALDAFTTANPAEAPALAAAALQIADQRLELEHSGRERAARAAEIARLAARITTLENQLRRQQRRREDLEREIAVERAARMRDTAEQARSREQLRELAGRARTATAESERLTRECGRWMARALATDDPERDHSADRRGDPR